MSSADKDWWRGATIYQIYPRSFADSNGDGLGDLAGITGRMDYIAALGVDAIWISPFFKSPMADFGYDVSDYCDVDPLFGTLADFDTLLAAAHDRGLKVLIDLVISHTSDQHSWFIESRRDRTNPKADWYVWADGKRDGTPPNNWLSIFGGSSWQWDTSRQQYYLHNFLTSQPDLNFHNPDVQTAVLDAAEFWLKRGVDGFRLDTVNFYFHDALLRDNPPIGDWQHVTTVPPSNPYSRQMHLFDKTQPENLEFLARFRRLLDRYPGSTTVGELGVDEEVVATMAAYTTRDHRLHMAYGFDFMRHDISAPLVRQIVSRMEGGIGSGWVSWAFSNHDVKRVVSRWGYDDVAAEAGPMLVALAASLRGTPCLYQGEELALTEADVPFHLLQDPYGKQFWPTYKGRDGCRTPMPWEGNAPNGGFSAASPWLPVAESHLARAVNSQQGQDASPLARVTGFLHWRRTQAPLKTGDISFLDTPEPVVAFRRSLNGETLLCCFNLGRSPVSLPVSGSLLPVPGFSATLTGGTLTLPPLGAAFLVP